MTGFLPYLQLLQNTLQPFRKHRIEDYLSGIRIISNIQFKSCHVFLISPKVTFGSVRRKKQTNILDTFDIKSIIEGLDLTYYQCCPHKKRLAGSFSVNKAEFESAN